MSSAKLIVPYPQPVDIDAFEKLYVEEHVPLAVTKLEGKTKIVATKILASPSRSFIVWRKSIFLR
jgi:hypothetical protein